MSPTDVNAEVLELDDAIHFGRQVAILNRDEVFQRVLREFEANTIRGWQQADSPTVRQNLWQEQHTIERLRQFMAALMERADFEQDAVTTAVQRERMKPETRDEKRLTVLS